MIQLLLVGYVTSARGVRGEIKIKALANPPVALLTCKEWYLVPQSAHTSDSSAAKPFQVVAVRESGNMISAQLQGVDNRNQAEELCGYEIYIQRSLLPQTAEDEFYWVDLIGLQVWHMDDESSDFIGVIKNLLETPAHSVLVIEDTESASSIPKSQILIPFIKVYIRHVDLARKRVEVNWPKAWRE